MLGIAVAVAVPEYMRLRSSAGDDSARARLTQASTTLQHRHAAAGTYAGAALPAGVRLRTTGNGPFCVETKAGGHAWHATRNAKPAPGSCPR